MSTLDEESQQEELEVLRSIYDGDDRFKHCGGSTFTYTLGEPGEARTFLVEISWHESYPSEVPTINLNTFYNNHLTAETKAAIRTALLNEAMELIGTPMTYSLFEYAKEHLEDMISSTAASMTEKAEKESSASAPLQGVPKAAKKEALSKQAKRRMADRTDAKGELPRGWNWVDIIKLSKTGNQS